MENDFSTDVCGNGDRNFLLNVAKELLGTKRSWEREPIWF